MALSLFIDVSSKTLLKASNTKIGGLLPPFFFGSKVTLNVYPLIPNPVNDPLTPYVAASWSGYALSAELGSADADDATGPVAYQDTFTTISGGFTAILDLNTQELKDLIGSEQSAKTYFEVKATPPGESADVIFQTPINVNGIVYDPDAMPTPITSFTSRFVLNEIPSGTINGSNTAFTLAFTPLTGTLCLFQDGLLLKNGLDYTLTATTITFVTAPASGDLILANYIK